VKLISVSFCVGCHNSNDYGAKIITFYIGGKDGKSEDLLFAFSIDSLEKELYSRRLPL
jgi:hypothetical protein